MITKKVHNNTMAQSLCGGPLLIVFLLGFSGQLSPVGAGVIPLGNREILSKTANYLDCPDGSYRAVKFLASGEESLSCRVCSTCPYGVLVLRLCNSTGDSVCSEQCKDANFTYNETLRACVSMLGGSHCSETASGIHFVWKVFGAITVVGIGTTVLALIARQRGYLKCLLPTIGAQQTSCKIVHTTLRRERFAHTTNPLESKSNVLTKIPLSAGSRDNQQAKQYSPMTGKEAHLPLAEDIQVNRSGEGPYWLVMRGWFTSRGGVLRCEDSDVFLEIPPGAIPESIQRQEIVAKVALVTSRFEFKLKKDEVCLSPVVELLSPGLDAFHGTVNIHIPHRALLVPGSDWSFKVHYTRSYGKTEKGWQTVEEDRPSHSSHCKCISCLGSLSSDVTFVTNSTHFVIRTSHFSKYTCSGCSKKRYLNLEAVVSAKYVNLPDRQQVDLNCYVMDTIKDYWQRLKENEGRRPRSERHPLHLKSKDPLIVSLLTDEKTLGDGWTWRAETYGGHRPTSVAIPIRNIVRCCSDAVPYFVTFSLRPRLSDNNNTTKALFESLVSYRQKESSLELPISMAFDMRDPEKCLEQLSPRPQILQLASDELIRNVALEIPGNKWRDLFRRLLEGDSHVDRLIEELQQNYHDMGERKYQMLQTWRQRKGRDATAQRLSQTLRACVLVEVAERIECGVMVEDVISLSSSEV